MKTTLPPAFLRRVKRVLETSAPNPLQTDENIDDVILLWRALERTFGVGATAGARARDAVSDLISSAGITSLPAVLNLAKLCRKFEMAPDVVIDSWFLGPDFQGALATERSVWRSRLVRLSEAGSSPPQRWKSADSKDLASFLYAIRNGVMHGSLETTTDLAVRVFPAVRSALLDLCAAKASVAHGITVAAAYELLSIAAEDEAQ